jgi:cell wall integrity and stress response component
VEGDGNDSSLSPGSIAGIVIGCGAALAAIGLFMFWWFFYRRRQGSVKDDDYSSSFFERSVPRPMFQGTLGSRDAALAAASAEKGVNGYQSDPTSRLSVPAFTDSRLSPQVCLYPNGRGNSHVSLQDHQDYSRPVLRVSFRPNCFHWSLRLLTV